MLPYVNLAPVFYLIVLGFDLLKPHQKHVSPLYKVGDALL